MNKYFLSGFALAAVVSFGQMKQSLHLMNLVNRTLASPSIVDDGEVIPKNEDQVIAEIAATIGKAHRAESEQKQNSGKKMTRDAHAKHHGCVKASFKVREDISETLRHGIFEPGAEHDAWIRFSNGSGKSQDDHEGDGRGMAIKLLGIEGDKILDDEKEAKTQDFLMINHDVFFARNAADMLEMTKVRIANEGNPIKFFFPAVWPWTWRLHELFIAKKIVGKEVSDVLSTRYFSMVPYQLGPHQIKFSAKPCEHENRKLQSEGPNFLSDNLVKSLREEEACFQFMVQRRIQNDEDMPIEDPTIEWSQEKAPYVSVAEIRIPKQEFNTESQMAFCEDLSMTPWHSLPEHRPLGGINRTRKAVYHTISTLRHEVNKVPREEP